MRLGRIELPPARWQRAVLPLNYSRKIFDLFITQKFSFFNLMRPPGLEPGIRRPKRRVISVSLRAQ